MIGILNKHLKCYLFSSFNTQNYFLVVTIGQSSMMIEILHINAIQELAAPRCWRQRGYYINLSTYSYLTLYRLLARCMKQTSLIHSSLSNKEANYNIIVGLRMPVSKLFFDFTLIFMLRFIFVSVANKVFIIKSYHSAIYNLIRSGVLF